MKKIISIITLGVAIIATPILYKTFAAKNSESKNGISVSANVLTSKEECIEAFGKNGGKLLKNKRKKIYPIKINITNNNPQKTATSLTRTNLKLTTKKRILSRIQNNWNLLKVIGLGAGVFIVSTAALFYSYIPLLFCIPSTGYAVLDYPIAYTIFFGIPAAAALASPTAMIIYGSKLKKRNKKSIQKLFGSKQFILEPSQTQTLFLFAEEKNYKENIELTFKDGNGNEETFNCHCPLT